MALITIPPQFQSTGLYIFHDGSWAFEGKHTGRIELIYYKNNIWSELEFTQFRLYRYLVDQRMALINQYVGNIV